MQKTESNPSATIAHRKVQSSTTLNRRYVTRPASMQRRAVMSPMSKSDVMIKRPTIDMDRVGKKMKAKTTPVMPEKQPSAQELKERAIAKALANASKPDEAEMSGKKQKKESKLHLGFGRVFLALACAAAAVFAIVYFVNLNMPDISMRVAAMQSGIDPKYPGYVPRDFTANDIVAEEGKIILNFKNNNTGDSFSIEEERSSWDSNALLSNYVKANYGEDFTTVREQGLTIYMTATKATWTNGGMLYKLNVTSGTLTKKQIRSIAVSL